jgi:hypothetical protein
MTGTLHEDLSIFKTIFRLILRKMINATIFSLTLLNVTFIRSVPVLFPFGAVSKDPCICKFLVYKYIKELIISLTELSHSAVNNRILCSGKAKFGIPTGSPYLPSSNFSGRSGILPANRVRLLLFNLSPTVFLLFQPTLEKSLEEVLKQLQNQ